jgi:hypothetical protein
MGRDAGVTTQTTTQKLQAACAAPCPLASLLTACTSRRAPPRPLETLTACPACVVSQRFRAVPTLQDSRRRLECDLAHAEQPIFLILDGGSYHHSRLVKDYVASLSGKLRLFFLPPYSPELNPDEQVWNYLKHHGVAKAGLRSGKELPRADLASQPAQYHRWQRNSDLHLTQAKPEISSGCHPPIAEEGNHGTSSRCMSGDCGADWDRRTRQRRHQSVEFAPKLCHFVAVALGKKRNVQTGTEHAGLARHHYRTSTIHRCLLDGFPQR